MKFQCLHCNQHYEIDEKFAGSSLHCKSCGNIMKVPIPLGKSVIINPGVLSISDTEVIRRERRRRRHRIIRRVLLTAGSLIAGAIIGIVCHMAYVAFFS